MIGGGCAISYRPPRRGRITVGPETLTCYDPLGLAHTRIPLRADGDILVLPRPLPPSLPTESATADSAHDTAAGAPTRRGRGADGQTQYGELREYRPGDRLGSVHWRQSARVDRLLVVDREHGNQRPRRLRLDVCADAYTAGPEEPAHPAAAFESAVSTAAGAIEAWARAGHDVELRLGAERRRAAAAHSISLLRRLAMVEPTIPPEADTATSTHACDISDSDVIITGVAAGPWPQSSSGAVVLTAGAESDADSVPDAGPAVPEAESATPAAPPATPEPSRRDAPSARPHLRAARWQPLAAARRALAELAEAAMAGAFGGPERINGEEAEHGVGDRRPVRLPHTGTTGLARTTSSVRCLRARALPASLWRRRH